MNILIPEHRAFIKTLNDAGVDYILVGGYAVIIHGYARGTGDMDVWVRPDNENKSAVLFALEAAGMDDESLAHVQAFNFEEPTFFHFDEEPARVDILTRISRVSYPEAKEQAKWIEADGLKFPVLHLHHLVLSKMTTGRPQDAADIAELQRIEAARQRLHKHKD